MTHPAKETKSEAQNPKFETISKLQIQRRNFHYGVHAIEVNKAGPM